MPPSFSAVRADHQLVIQGGFLPEGRLWAPSELVAIDGEYFLPLRRKDRQLAAFCGMQLKSTAPMAGCHFLDELVAKRDDICNNICRSIVSQLGCSAKRSVDWESKVPRTVVLSMPALREGENDVQLKVLFEDNVAKVVTVHVTNESMEYIAHSIHKDSLDSKRKFRSKEEGVPEVVLGPHVHWVKGGKMLYTAWKNRDGKLCKKFKTVCRLVDRNDTDGIQAAASSLREHWENSQCKASESDEPNEDESGEDPGGEDEE